MSAELISVRVKGELITNFSQAALLKDDEVKAELVKLIVLESGVDSDEVVWHTVNERTQTFSNNAYNTANDLSRVVLKMPISPPIPGDLLIFHNQGLGGFRIEQNDGQVIRVGNKTTTLGQQGSIVSTDIGDYLGLVFVGDIWTCADINGNLELL